MPTRLNTITGASDNEEQEKGREQAERHNDASVLCVAAHLEKALSDGGVRHRAGIYPGARHGWMKSDFPIHDDAAAARGWREMFALFDRELKPGRPRSASHAGC